MTTCAGFCLIENYKLRFAFYEHHSKKCEDRRNLRMLKIWRHAESLLYCEALRKWSYDVYKYINVCF
jgi:hypothetical protein